MDYVVYTVLFLLILLIGSYVLFQWNHFRIHKHTPKRYAVCVWGEPHDLHQCIEPFYQNLVAPLDADVYVLLSSSHTSSDATLALYEDAVYRGFYEEVFDDAFVQRVEHYGLNGALSKEQLKQIIKFYNIAEMCGSKLEADYDYVIMARANLLHLFRFPDVSRFFVHPDTVKDDTFWSYGTHDEIMVVPAKYAQEYLRSPYEFIVDPTYEPLMAPNMNYEDFMNNIFEQRHWKRGTIQRNAFIAVDAREEEIRTWEDLKRDKDLNVWVHRHDESYKNEAKRALDLWNRGKGWYKQKGVARIELK